MTFPAAYSPACSPLPRPRPRNTPSSRIDNILSIGDPQAAVQSGTSPGRNGPSWAVQLTLDAAGSYGRRVADDFAARYAGLLARFHCVDRIVLNAYYPIGNTAGGFRTWWRRLIGGPDAAADAVLDNTHLMRLAGRFARRVRAWAADSAVPVIAAGNTPAAQGDPVSAPLRGSRVAGRP